MPHQRSEGGFTFCITNVQRPIPGPLDVLIQLSVTGVCGTDIGLASGELGPTRSILGHEGVGRVVQLGTAVSESQSHIKVGDRVGIAWLRDICGTCDFCMQPGGETRCQEQLNSGRKVDGTFAEYALAPSRYLLRIPEGIPDEQVAPILCGGVTAYAALKNSGGIPGQWIAVSGAGGGVGGLAVQYAKAMGYRVVAIDVGDAKRQFCLDSGADHFIDASSSDPREGVLKATQQRGANVVLACATSGRAYQSALDILAPFGTFVCVGIPPPAQLVSFHPLLFLNSGIRIIGSAVGTRQEVLEALEFVARGVVTPHVVLRTLEDLPDIGAQFSQVSRPNSGSTWTLHGAFTDTEGPANWQSRRPHQRSAGHEVAVRGCGKDPHAR